MKRTFLALSLCLLSVVSWGVTLPNYDPMQKHVTDTANYLQKSEAVELNRKLTNFEATSSTQIAVVTINSLEGLEPVDYAQQLFKQWGIGQKDKNNGILLLVAKQDNKIRIHVGYGLEGALPDITAKQIITKDIRPLFNNKKYAESFNAGTDSIMKACAGEYAGVPKNEGLSTPIKAGIGIVLLLLLIVIIYSITHPESDMGLMVWAVCDTVSDIASSSGGGGSSDSGSGFGGGDSGGGGADG